MLGSIFLASKIEECPRKIQDIVNVFGYVICNQKGLQNEWLHYVDKVQLTPPPHSYMFCLNFAPEYIFKEFYLLKDSMFFAEISILGLLGFNVQVQHPHGFMINYLKSLELQDNHDLAQRAWNYLNDRYFSIGR